MKKEEIVDAVKEAECPMLDDLNLETISKDKLIKHLTNACCPVLEKLAAI